MHSPFQPWPLATVAGTRTPGIAPHNFSGAPETQFELAHIRFVGIPTIFAADHPSARLAQAITAPCAALGTTALHTPYASPATWNTITYLVTTQISAIHFY